VTTDNERAALLAEEIANALHAARASLSAAADLAEQTDNALSRGEDDISELTRQAFRMGGNEPRPYLNNAQQLAYDLDDRMRNGRRAIEEVGDHLAAGARAINAGQRALAELDWLPGQPAGVTEALRTRLDVLDGAVQQTRAAVRDADNRLEQARGNLRRLVNGELSVDDPRLAEQIGEAGIGVNQNVNNARIRLAETRTRLEAASPDTHAVAAESAELAARVGLNPTAAAGQRSTASNSEMDLRRRLDGPAQGRDRGRT
jgi:hypothetical protein